MVWLRGNCSGCSRVSENGCGIVARNLSSREGPIEVDGSHKAAIGVFVNGLTFGHHRAWCEIVTWSTGEHDYLKAERLLGKQCAEPLHPEVVALDELIVEDDRARQVLGERQPVERGELLPR